MTFTVAELRNLHPFDATRTRTVIEAIACYVVFVAAITILSLIIGPLIAMIAGGGVGVFVMRLANGFVTGYLGMRIVKARGLSESYWLAVVGVAAFFSAIGYEIIGLALVAALTCRAKA